MSRLLLPLVPLAAPAPATPPPGDQDGLAAWVAAVSAAVEPCLVLTATGRVAAASSAVAELFGRATTEVVGRSLVDDVISLIDFTAAGGAGDDYVDRIPPLLVLRSGAPARGLLRIRREDGSQLTMDAVAAPLRDSGGEIAGSVSFLAAVPVS